jgi:hypothetical protein
VAIPRPGAVLGLTPEPLKDTYPGRRVLFGKLLLAKLRSRSRTETISATVGRAAPGTGFLTMAITNSADGDEALRLGLAVGSVQSTSHGFASGRRRSWLRWKRHAW